jgi:hypothetical protein
LCLQQLNGQETIMANPIPGGSDREPGAQPTIAPPVQPTPAGILTTGTPSTIARPTPGFQTTTGQALAPGVHAAAGLESRTVTALFSDRASAERAYQVVTRRGYGSSDLSLVMSDEARDKHFSPLSAATELGNKAAKGAGVGGTIGGALGAIVAAVAAIGTTLVLPGVGLVVAGPLAAALAGAGAGGAAGTLVGALIGWGIPEERVKHYEAGIKQGGILLGVHAHTEEDAAYFEREWRDLQGAQVAR